MHLDDVFIGVVEDEGQNIEIEVGKEEMDEGKREKKKKKQKKEAKRIKFKKRRRK